MQKPFRSTDLADLSLSSQQNRDAALLRATTDLFAQEPSHDRDAVRRYEELATHFLPRVTAADRAFVAERLADRADAPASVLRFLARDSLDIARPILVASPALGPLDLLTVIAATGPEHHRLIAERDTLTPDVERALRLMGDTETAAIVARKREARAGAATAGAAAAQPPSAPAPAGDAEPAPRPRPEPEVVSVNPASPAAPLSPYARRREIAGPNPVAVDVWQFLALDRPHRLRLVADLTTRPPPRRYTGPARRLDQTFRSILGAAQIVSFARRSQRAELVSAIAEGLQIDVEVVIACLDDATGEAFAILLKVLGLDNIQAQQVFLLATPTIGRDVNAFFRLTDVYAGLETFVAEILVAAWRGDLAAPLPRHEPVFAPLAARRPAGAPAETVRELPADQGDRIARKNAG